MSGCSGRERACSAVALRGAPYALVTRGVGFGVDRRCCRGVSVKSTLMRRRARHCRNFGAVIR